MVDYFTHFSCLFDVRSPENIDRALAIYANLERELDEREGAPIGFLLTAERTLHSDKPASTSLWITDEESGDPEHVIAFVKRCGEALGLTGVWGFVWSYTCSRPRLDGYGGGAQAINLATSESVWCDLDHWLAEQLADGVPGSPADLPAVAADLLALLKEPAQPMGLSEHDFRRWLPRARGAIARAEGALASTVSAAPSAGG